MPFNHVSLLTLLSTNFIPYILRDFSEIVYLLSPVSLSPTHSLPPFPGQKLRELYVRCNQLSDFAVLQPLTELSSLKVRSIHFF